MEISGMDFLYILLIGVFHASFANTSLQKSRFEIVGGRNARSGEFTYHVSLQYNNIHICGGGLLNKQYVISAAHCVLDKNGTFHQKQLTAVFGIIDLVDYNHDSILEIPTVKIFIPKEFKIELFLPRSHYRTTGDIAIFKLQDPIKPEALTRLTILRLPSNSSNDFEDTNAIISGFGFNEIKVIRDPERGIIENGSYDGMLHYAKATVLSNGECDQFTYQNIYDSHLCARVNQRASVLGPKGVCKGDSGGPLVREGNVLIGILSTGPIGCDESIEPAVYTRISSFKDFIENALNNIFTSDMRVATWYVFNCRNMQPYLRERVFST